MKFLADMGISPRTVSYLQNLGYDAVHLSEQRLHRLADDEILRKARDEGWVLLTHDLDFGDLLAASSAELPSVIIFRLRDMRPNQVNRYLEEVVTEYQVALEEGAIVSVVEGRIRLRSLPIILTG